MNISSVVTGLGKLAVKRGPELMTGLAVAGTINTAFLASRATAKAQRIVDEDEINNGFDQDVKARWKNRVRLAWRLYIPTTISGVTTISAIILANRLSVRREAALASTLAAAQVYMARYADVVEEVLDDAQREKVQERFSQVVAEQTPLPSNFESGVLVEHAGGTQLFLDTISGRYFMSELSDVRDAILSAREQIHSDNYVTLSDLYDMLNLAHTAQSDYLGWTSYSKFDVETRGGITKDGHSVITISYGTLPKAIDLRWE